MPNPNTFASLASLASRDPNPTPAHTLAALKAEIFNDLRACMPGIVQSFDPAACTAAITLALKFDYMGEIHDYPLLVDVPLFIYTGAGARITMPVAPGDTCLVFFSDRDYDTCWATGAAAVPNSARKHSIADGFALVGFRTRANKLPDYNTTDIALQNNGGKLTIGEKITIANTTQNLLQILLPLLDSLTLPDTNGDAPNPQTLTAISTAKQQLAALLA